MTMQKKFLASAIVAGLAVSANAQAAVSLDGDADPLVYASEIEDGTTLSDLNDDVMFAVGYNFSGGEVRNGRFECTTNMTLDDVTLSETGGNVALGSINGEGTSALFFSMTGDGDPSAADTISVDSSNTLLDGGAVQCAFSIYDQPSQAQAGGETGRIYTTGWKTVITRESGFVFGMGSGDGGQAVADVEDPDGAYFGFVDGDSDFGNLAFYAMSEGVLDEDGSSIQLSDIFAAETTITIEGSLVGADDTCPIIHDDLGCPDAVDLDGDVVTFDVGSTSINDDLYFNDTGMAAILESGYTATLHAVAQTGYDVSDVGPINVGEIVRNGTQLQAPLAQVPGAGWLSRMVLTNTGSTDRLYEISVSGEAGNDIGTANTLGVVPANGTVVVDLTQVMISFSEGQQRRGTLNVTVAAPNDQIQGLYQIVNANTGSISNHVMVRPYAAHDDEGGLR